MAAVLVDGRKAPARHFHFRVGGERGKNTLTDEPWRSCFGQVREALLAICFLKREVNEQFQAVEPIHEERAWKTNIKQQDVQLKQNSPLRLRLQLSGTATKLSQSAGLNLHQLAGRWLELGQSTEKRQGGTTPALIMGQPQAAPIRFYREGLEGFMKIKVAPNYMKRANLEGICL
jgi:hypothetical protein